MKYSEQPWVILFGGAERESIIERLISEGIKIKSVIVPSKRSSRLSTSVSKLATLDLEIRSVEKNQLGDMLASYKECCLLSVGFPFIIPQQVFSQHKVAINIHPTLLPKYRGPTTGAYVLIENESESGSTVHYLEEEVDKGDIILQSKVKLTPFDTIYSLQRKVYEKEPDLVMAALDNLDRGLLPTSQDESEASIYPKRRTPADSEIDPSKPLIELIHEIRASHPEEFPAHFYYHGQKVCIKLWRDEKTKDEFDEI